GEAPCDPGRCHRLHQRRPALSPAGEARDAFDQRRGHLRARRLGQHGRGAAPARQDLLFFALQGIRRQYARVEIVFLAHAAQAWEFEESQFFQAASSGGTLASSAFRLALEVMQARYDPSRHNVYFFYASDGENADEDRYGAASL